MAKLQVSDVFGQDTSENPRSYVKRDIETNFHAALTNRALEAIVVYGTSKQGKSSLRRSALPDTQCTFFGCSAGLTRQALYQGVLNKVRAVGRTSTNRSSQTEGSGKFAFNPLRWFGGEASISRSRGRGEIREDVPIDYTAASAVAERYFQAAGRRPIVLDNFHYADLQVQKELATDIRAFGERGIKWVIFGTWAAEDYLERLNSDLSGRIKTLSIEPWLPGDLARVLTTGEELLRIKFADAIRASIISRSAGNVALLQTGTQRYLQACKISERRSRLTILTEMAPLTEIFREIASERIAQTTNLLREIANSGEPIAKGRTRMYWLLRAMLESQQIVNATGIRLDHLLTATNALLAKEGVPIRLDAKVAGKLIKHDLQHAQARMQTPIIAYDELTDSVRVLDAWTLFTVRRFRADIAAAL